MPRSVNVEADLGESGSVGKTGRELQPTAGRFLKSKEFGNSESRKARGTAELNLAVHWGGGGGF